MNEPGKSAEDLPLRLKKLERRFVYLLIAFIILLVVGVAVYVHDTRALRRSFQTGSLFTAQIDLPRPGEWPSSEVSAELAMSQDGKTISLILGPNVVKKLAGRRDETRVEFEASGAQRIELRDRQGKVRVRVATAADGSPSISVLRPDGSAAWSVP